MTTKAEYRGIIRAKCIDCCVGQLSEVRHCTAYTCELHPHRMGKDPNPAKVGFAVIPPPDR